MGPSHHIGPKAENFPGLWSEGDVTKEAGSESAVLLAFKTEEGVEARNASQPLEAGEGKDMGFRLGPPERPAISLVIVW